MEQNLKIWTEIPSGSIPCNSNSYYNKTHFITIQSYSTQKLQCYFYFPQANDNNYSYPIDKIMSSIKSGKLNG